MANVKLKVDSCKPFIYSLKHKAATTLAIVMEHLVYSITGICAKSVIHPVIGKLL